MKCERCREIDLASTEPILLRNGDRVIGWFKTKGFKEDTEYRTIQDAQGFVVDIIETAKDIVVEFGKTRED